MERDLFNKIRIHRNGLKKQQTVVIFKVKRAEIEYRDKAGTLFEVIFFFFRIPM